MLARCDAFLTTESGRERDKNHRIAVWKTWGPRFEFPHRRLIHRAVLAVANFK
jgi:hypothetical protein